MFFLLPETEKQALYREYAGRRWAVLLGLVLVLIIIAFVLLVPSYSQIWLEVRQAKERLEILEAAAQDIATPEELEKIEVVAKQIELLQPDQIFTASESVITFSDSAPSGVVLTMFIYDRPGSSGDEAMLNLSVQGVAANRRALLDFVSTLRDKDQLAEVELPVRELARDIEIDFNLSISAYLQEIDSDQE